MLYACDRGWISREATGKAGAAVVGVLSMGKPYLYVARTTEALIAHLASHWSLVVISIFVSGCEMG